MTMGVERPPYGTRHRKFSPFSFQVLMRPFSTETPSRFGPRSSGQSPARTRLEPCAGSDTHSAATIAATRLILFNIDASSTAFSSFALYLFRYAGLPYQCLRTGFTDAPGQFIATGKKRVH